MRPWHKFFLSKSARFTVWLPRFSDGLIENHPVWPVFAGSHTWTVFSANRTASGIGSGSTAGLVRSGFFTMTATSLLTPQKPYLFQAVSRVFLSLILSYFSLVPKSTESKPRRRLYARPYQASYPLRLSLPLLPARPSLLRAASPRSQHIVHRRQAIGESSDPLPLLLVSVLMLLYRQTQRQSSKPYRCGGLWFRQGKGESCIDTVPATQAFMTTLSPCYPSLPLLSPHLAPPLPLPWALSSFLAEHTWLRWVRCEAKMI